MIKSTNCYSSFTIIVEVMKIALDARARGWSALAKENVGQSRDRGREEASKDAN